MIKKVAVIVALVMIASLSVAGCTVGLPSTSSPTPTPTPIPASTPVPTPVDYSSALTKSVESTNFIMERPFTKSASERGNDVYKGVGRNSTNPGSASVTLVFEVTKSQSEAKKVYDGAVATKLNEGYTANPSQAANYKAHNPGVTEVWAGSSGTKGFLCYYDYNTAIFNSWEVIQQSKAS
jgi:hypothetical protein